MSEEPARLGGVWKESVVNIELHCARVYIAEARRRRGQKFAITLLLWAANARKRAASEPKQRDLFSANSGEA